MRAERLAALKDQENDSGEGPQVHHPCQGEWGGTIALSLRLPTAGYLCPRRMRGGVSGCREGGLGGQGH